MTIIWDYLVELRKELVEAQKIRSQIIGFKITLVTAGYGFIFSNIDKIHNLSDQGAVIIALPAMAAVFFDFLIDSYSFSIKRIGYYVQYYIEPVLKKDASIPDDFVFWQRFLTQSFARQYLSIYGNFGLTIISVATSIVSIVFAPWNITSCVIIILLLLLIPFGVCSFFKPRRFVKYTRTLA